MRTEGHQGKGARQGVEGRGWLPGEAQQNMKTSDWLEAREGERRRMGKPEGQEVWLQNSTLATAVTLQAATEWQFR